VAREVIRRGPRRNLAGLIVTLALHGAILLTVARAHGQPEPPLIVRHDFVEAELVKLGKPREKFWLPRLVQPPRATAPPDTIKVADNPNARPAPREAPRPEDPLISKDLKRALQRARRLEALATPDEPDEGSLTGSKLGTSNHEVGDQYLAEVKGTLLQNYALPAGIAPEQIAKPPMIQMTIGLDGTLSGIKLRKTSGNGFVDDACVNAAQITRRVPPPPAPYGNRVIGVECDK
jgi:TonB-like protein